MTKQTYMTRVLTARDHRLVDALEQNPRFRKIAAILRPQTQVRKPVPKPTPRPADEGRQSAARSRRRRPPREPSGHISPGSAQDAKPEPSAETKPGHAVDGMTSKNTGLSPKTSGR